MADRHEWGADDFPDGDRELWNATIGRGRDVGQTDAEVSVDLRAFRTPMEEAVAEADDVIALSEGDVGAETPRPQAWFAMPLEEASDASL